MALRICSRSNKYHSTLSERLRWFGSSIIISNKTTSHDSHWYFGCYVPRPVHSTVALCTPIHSPVLISPRHCWLIGIRSSPCLFDFTPQNQEINLNAKWCFLVQSEMTHKKVWGKIFESHCLPKDKWEFNKEWEFLCGVLAVASDPAHWLRRVDETLIIPILEWQLSIRKGVIKII